MEEHLTFSYDGPPILDEEIQEFVDLDSDNYDGSPIFDEEIEEYLNFCVIKVTTINLFFMKSLMSISLICDLKQLRLIQVPYKTGFVDFEIPNIVRHWIEELSVMCHVNICSKTLSLLELEEKYSKRIMDEFSSIGGESANWHLKSFLNSIFTIK